MAENGFVLPGGKSKEMIAELQKYVVVDPHPFAIDLQRCSGMYLATVDGQRIFDWAGYYGSKLLGHNHPRLKDPLYRRRLALAADNKTANPDFITGECLEYYRLVHRLAPMCMKNDRLEVYVVNSGAEAVENMMKYLTNLHDEKMLKQGKLTFASEKRLQKYLKLKPGSVSPFGLIYDKDKHVKIFLDINLKKVQKISFHPNDNTASLIISFEDFLKFLNYTGQPYDFLNLY